MFPGIGTVINVAAILFGATAGVFFGAKLPARTRVLITDVLGLVTLLGAAGAIGSLWTPRFLAALPTGWSLLCVLVSLLIGGFIGSVAKLEEHLDNFGEQLRKRFGASAESPFVEGFVAASLLFAIGPLAILGSISDGMSTGIDQLLLKSTLDGFAAMAFAASLGWGVALAFIPVAIYQGFWTVIGLALGSVMADYQVDAMTATGGVMLVCIGFRLLKLKEVAVGNLLPSLAVAPLAALALHSFVG